jgi:hypothetical protein
MRFVLPVVVSLALFALFVGPSAAQKNDEVDKTKRIAQIEKELAELQEKIAKLKAELAQLQPVTGKIPPGKHVVVRGTITKMEQGRFWLTSGINSSILFILREDSQIMYSDNDKANPSDLKVGQSVRVHSRQEELGLKKEPQSGFAYVVIIEKEQVIREIILKEGEGYPQQIAKQVDFSKEYILRFGWTGANDDRLFFRIDEAAFPIVVFDLTRGKDKQETAHVRVFAVTKNGGWSIAERERVPLPTRINSVEELAKAFPGTK